MKRFFKLFLLGIFLSLSGYTQPILTTSSTSNCTDGTLTINISSGDAPFQYEVSNKDYSYSSGSVYSNHLVLTGLPHGYYYIIVKDASGSIYDAQKEEQIANPFNISYTRTGATCNNNGSLSVEAIGGTAPYTYSWSNGATDQKLDNLSPGEYFVTVTDAYGCKSVSDSLFVEQNSTFSAYTNSTPYTCHQKGTSTVETYGEGAPFTYYWKTIPIQATQTVTGLDIGNYEVIVTNALGCSVTASAEIWQSNAFDLTPSTTDETCNQANGSASIIASGGAAPYTYLWNTNSTSPSISNLTSSEYNVTATDADGCTSTRYIFISKTSPIQAVFSTISTHCQSADGSVTVTANGGTAPYNYNWYYNSDVTNATLSNVSYGTYYVNIKDASGCETIASAYIEEQPNCKGTITGSVYNDINGNCIQDNGEEGAPYTVVKISDQNYISTNQNGDYSIDLYPGEYTITAYPNSNWTTICPVAPLALNVASGASYPDNNFFITPIKVTSDVSVMLYNSLQRPGFTRPVYISYYNKGTQIESATIDYTFSNDWNFAWANPMPDTYDAATRTATWKSPTLNPGYDYNSIEIYMNVPPTVSIGTALTANAQIHILHTDENIDDNHASILTYTTNSYDPNDLQVSPQGTGSEGYISDKLNELTYRVGFQNTGNDVAYNVTVKCNIDVNLEDYTISVVSASHAVQMSIEEGLLSFNFNNINLSDSTSNEPASHGYIIYKINKKSDLAPLTQILNKADIYFDYNSAITTNQVKNTIAFETSNPVAIQNGDDITFYPNPCKDKVELSIHVKESSDVSVQLYSSNGQQISVLDNIPVEQGRQVIDLNLGFFNLTNGLYVAKVLMNDQVYTRTIVINK